MSVSSWELFIGKVGNFCEWFVSSLDGFLSPSSSICCQWLVDRWRERTAHTHSQQLAKLDNGHDPHIVNSYNHFKLFCYNVFVKRSILQSFTSKPCFVSVGTKM